MDVLQAATLMAATLTTGLVAGVYGLYGHTIMPALGRTDDRTFVTAFQALDRAILNPWFLGGGFIGSLLFTAASAIVHFGRAPWPWVVAALALLLITVAVTVRVHLPLNDAIKAAGDPGAIDVATTRAAFGEARWRRWNRVRTVGSTAACASLIWASVLHGAAASRN